MKAYKTYADCPVERWPVNAQSTHIWIAQESVDQTAEEAAGFTVVSDEDYNILVTAQDSYFDSQVSTFDKDKAKYLKRAKSLNTIMSEIAAENMSRVRAGTWTVQQLVDLTQDEGIKQIISDLAALSFEIAYGKIDALTPAILTQEIKDAFKAKLASNF